MTRKNRTTKDSPPLSRVERYTVGSGLTKRGMVSVTGLKNPSPEALAAIEAIFENIGKVSTFDGRIRSSEKWAQDVVTRDPDAERRPYESEAWYAAEILSEVRLLRKIMARIQTDPAAASKETDALAKFAFELGVLASEAAHKFNFEPDTLRGMASMRGSKSPKPPRRCIPMEGYIQARRRDRDLTFDQFWEELKTYRDGIADPLEIGNVEACYRNGKIEIFEPGKKSKKLQKSTILRYWEVAKPRTK